MKSKSKLGAIALLIFNILLFDQSKNNAQVVPDETLGSESSTINSIDELRSRIEGGAIRGENLFHSFEEFRGSGHNRSYSFFAHPVVELLNYDCCINIA